MTYTKKQLDKMAKDHCKAKGVPFTDWSVDLDEQLLIVESKKDGQSFFAKLPLGTPCRDCGRVLPQRVTAKLQESDPHSGPGRA